MGIKINLDNIDRAHRIGAYNRARKKPIVCFFKHKESLLSSGCRLKDSGFAVSKDFCRPVQLSNGILLNFRKRKTVVSGCEWTDCTSTISVSCLIMNLNMRTRSTKSSLENLTIFHRHEDRQTSNDA